MFYIFMTIGVGCVVAAMIALVSLSIIAVFSTSDGMESLEEEFDGSYWDDDINEDNFPGMDDEAEIQAVRPMRLKEGFTRTQALEALRKMNPPMKAASLDKCVLWHTENPEYQKTRRTICAAQTMFDDQGDEKLVIFPRGVRAVELDYAVKEFPADTEVFAELIQPKGMVNL